MKTALTVFFAALLGSAAALALYHVFWLQPQLRALGAATPPPTVAAPQAVAGQVVPTAASPAPTPLPLATQSTASPEDTASRIAAVRDAVRQATMFRVALTEYRNTQGRWPRNADEAGLPTPSETREGAVASIGIDAAGRVEVQLDSARFAPGSRIVLRPLREDAQGANDWACEIAGDPVLSEALPKCRR
jgi:Pilin (bacterial filament)